MNRDSAQSAIKAFKDVATSYYFTSHIARIYTPKTNDRDGSRAYRIDIYKRIDNQVDAPMAKCHSLISVKDIVRGLIGVEAADDFYKQVLHYDEVRHQEFIESVQDDPYWGGEGG